jgi:REP-associated tyrosine transposase
MSLKRKYEYRRDLPHIQNIERALFITFNTFHRWVMPAAARDLVFDAVLHGNGIHFQIEAFVVMPDHVHLVCWLRRRENGDPYALVEIMQAIKSASAHKINRLLSSTGAVWQTESFDHMVRSDELLEEYIEYVRSNPVRRGLVETPSDYKWLWISSVPVV